MSRILPRSITGQITGIVVVSVIAGMMLSLAIIVFIFGRPTPNATPGSIVWQIVNVTRFVQAADSALETKTILKVMQTAGIPVLRVPLSELYWSHNEGETTALPFDIVHRLEHEHGLEVLDGFHYGAESKQEIIIKVGGGDALIFNLNLESHFLPIFVTPAALLLTIVPLFVLLLSIYAVRWIISPLAAVSEAALSFGRSPSQPLALKQRGPKEIIQVTQALMEMGIRIRALLDDRTRMLAAISHDLRTPLTRLRLRAERMSDDRLREGVLGDLVKIGRMLDETLDYLRDESKSEPLARVDLPSLLQTICSEFSDVGMSVTYRGPGRLTLNCRPRALARAVTNVVENGVKHGISVFVTLIPAVSSGLEIEISDDGPGVPAEIRDKVFDPFFKADGARQNDKSGFGLGLSIAQDIVKRHGGKIGLFAGEPSGLAVRIQLPAEIC
jgi:signal transduction histidine kinase